MCQYFRFNIVRIGYSISAYFTDKQLRVQMLNSVNKRFLQMRVKAKIPFSSDGTNYAMHCVTSDGLFWSAINVTHTLRQKLQNKPSTVCYFQLKVKQVQLKCIRNRFPFLVVTDQSISGLASCTSCSEQRNTDRGTIPDNFPHYMQPDYKSHRIHIQVIRLSGHK